MAGYEYSDTGLKWHPFAHLLGRAVRAQLPP
jgi:hypothetical protein